VDRGIFSASCDGRVGREYVEICFLMLDQGEIDSVDRSDHSIHCVVHHWLQLSSLNLTGGKSSIRSSTHW
jgi:hypothetical protein